MARARITKLGLDPRTGTSAERAPGNPAGYGARPELTRSTTVKTPPSATFEGCPLPLCDWVSSCFIHGREKPRLRCGTSDQPRPQSLDHCRRAGSEERFSVNRGQDAIKRFITDVVRTDPTA